MLISWRRVSGACAPVWLLTEAWRISNRKYTFSARTSSRWFTANRWSTKAVRFLVVSGWILGISSLRACWSFAIFSFAQQFFSPFETFGGVGGQWHIEFERVSTSNEHSFSYAAVSAREKLLSSTIQMAVKSLIFCWFSGQLSWELMRHRAGLLVVSFSRNFHFLRIGPDSWGKFNYKVEICGSSSVLFSDSGVWVIRVVLQVGLLSILPSWDASTDVSGACCQKTSGVGGSIVLMVCSLSIAALERRSEFCCAFFRLQLVPFVFVFFSADGFSFCKFLCFLHGWNDGFGFSEFNLVAHWITVFICSSSGNSKPISFSYQSNCVAICSFVLFSKWARFVEFFRCSAILASTNSSIVAWAAIPNACLEFVDKNYLFWFDRLTTISWNLCSVVAIDRGLTYLLQWTAIISSGTSRVGLLISLSVCNPSPLTKDWKQLILFFVFG